MGGDLDTANEVPSTRGSAPPSAVAVSGVSHWFGPGLTEELALANVNLDVAVGEVFAVIGPSGCGKTTLLNIVSGLEALRQGRVFVLGELPSAGRPEIAYMLARDALLPWRTSIGNVTLPLEIARHDRRERAERAMSALREVGLENWADSYPAQLSQGMRQRVALARTVVTQPALILMDEPFAALDAQTKLMVQDGFLALRERLSSTVILITHDLSEAIALADRVAIMTRRPGRVKLIMPIDLPRPRSLVSLQSDGRFHGLYRELWEALRDEVQAGSAPPPGERIENDASNQ